MQVGTIPLLMILRGYFCPIIAFMYVPLGRGVLSPKQAANKLN